MVYWSFRPFSESGCFGYIAGPSTLPKTGETQPPPRFAALAPWQGESFYKLKLELLRLSLRLHFGLLRTSRPIAFSESVSVVIGRFAPLRCCLFFDAEGDVLEAEGVEYIIDLDDDVPWYGIVTV